MDLGDMQKLSVQMGDTNIYFRLLSNNYFLAVLAHKDALMGKIEYYSSLEAKKFMDAINA